MQNAVISETGPMIHLELAWTALRPLPRMATIFAQVGAPSQPVLSQVDGDAWRGFLPLFAWPARKTIVEIRDLEKPAASDLLIRLGIYDWTTGEQLPARDELGRPLPENAYIAPIRPVSQTPPP